MLTLTGKVKVYHYSEEDKDSIILDPKQSLSKRHYYSSNDYKLSKFPRVFYYTDLDKTEHQIRTGRNLYVGEVDGSKILMLFSAIQEYNKDKELLKYKNLQALEVVDALRGSGSTDWDAMFETASKYFDGVYYDREGTLPIINLFVPLKVKKYAGS